MFHVFGNFKNLPRWVAPTNMIFAEFICTCQWGSRVCDVLVVFPEHSPLACANEFCKIIFVGATHLGKFLKLPKT